MSDDIDAYDGMKAYHDPKGKIVFYRGPDLPTRIVDATCACGCHDHIKIGIQEDGAHAFLCPQCGTIRTVKVDP